MKIGKLILHYNTNKLTMDLCRMVPGAIVIDNGSRNFKPTLFSKHKTVRFKQNLGFTRNWNRAIRHLWNDFDAFWLMNSDIVISQESIRRIEHLVSTRDIPIITPSYNCWMKDCYNCQTGDIREIKCMEFTAPVIRKDVFEKIGMFDERFSLGYGCDFDFAFRMIKAGLKMYVDDGSSFHHIGQQTIKSSGQMSNYQQRAVKELESGMTELYGPEWKMLCKTKLNILKHEGMKKIAVYTTIFGGYDPLRDIPKQTIEADYYLITDNAKSFLSDTPAQPGTEQWNIVQMDYPRPDLHPRMRAKFFKLFPWECPDLAGYDIVIFIDGAFEITSADFVSHCLEHLKSDLLLYKHPVRDCIYDEARASVDLVKYKNETIKEQIAFYGKFHPPKWGLWACGVMVRKMTGNVRNIMASWWWENIKWSYQDQISLAVILRAHGIKPSVFPGNQMKNEYLRHHWRDDSTKEAKKIKVKAGNRKTTKNG